MEGQDMYQQSVETVSTEPQPGKGLAIAALVFGILSIVLSCCFGGVLAIPGLIMGIIANKKNKTGLGTAAIITSVIGIVLFVIICIICAINGAVLFSSSMSYY